MRLASEEDLGQKSPDERFSFSDNLHIDLNTPVADVQLQLHAMNHHYVTTWLDDLF